MTGIRNFRVGTSMIFLRRDDLDLLESSQQRCSVVTQKNTYLQSQQYDANKDINGTTPVLKIPHVPPKPHTTHQHHHQPIEKPEQQQSDQM